MLPRMETTTSFHKLLPIECRRRLILLDLRNQEWSDPSNGNTITYSFKLEAILDCLTVMPENTFNWFWLSLISWISRPSAGWISSWLAKVGWVIFMELHDLYMRWIPLIFLIVCHMVSLSIGQWFLSSRFFPKVSHFFLSFASNVKFVYTV